MRLSPRLVTLVLLAALSGAVVPVTLRAQALPLKLKSQLDGWYRTARRSAPGTWGIVVADQEGEILWSVNPDQLLVPASTVKLLTTGYARTVLGGDARRSTRVVGGWTTGRVER